MTPKLPPKANYVPAIIVTIALFSIWGCGHGLYSTLVPQFAKVFGLNQSALAATSSFYSVIYFLCAIPAALYARTFGYRAAIIFGLVVVAVGGLLIYQGAGQSSYALFLFAISVMSVGWIFLEVSAMPLLTRLGSEKGSASRLNLADAFYPIGALIGTYVARRVVMSDAVLPISQSAHAIVQPYIVFATGLLVLAFLIDKIPFPEVATERYKLGTKAADDYRFLWSRPIFVFAMVAQFFCIATQGGTWMVLSRYVAHELPTLASTTLFELVFWYWVINTAGRLTAAALMIRLDPDRVLAVFAGGGFLLAVTATFTGGHVGVGCLIASGFFLSIMFPTIFASALRDLGPSTKAGSALIFVAGSGGGIALLLLPMLWDATSLRFAMAVPTMSYIVVLAFAVANYRHRHPPAHPVPASARDPVCAVE